MKYDFRLPLSTTAKSVAVVLIHRTVTEGVVPADPSA